jgi:hypothetical protein
MINNPTPITKKSLFTGLCPMNVIAINPSADEIMEIYGREEVKDPEYSGQTEAGEAKLRLDIYLKNTENNLITKIVFWLEDRLSISSKGNKQFINSVGMSTWAADQPTQDWFTMKPYREGYVGEADLYNFLSAWLGINKRAKESECVLETSFSDIVRGNLDELRDLITIYRDRTVKVLLAVKEGKYQDVYNKVFIPQESNYTAGLEKQLKGDADAGFPYKGNYQNSFEFKEFNPESAPAESVSTSSSAPANISALLKGTGAPV